MKTRLFLLLVLLALTQPAQSQTPVTIKNCVTMCTIISDPAPAQYLPLIASCQLLHGGTQVADQPLVNGGCYFDVTIPLGEQRWYTARWRAVDNSTSPDSNALNLLSGPPVLPPPTNFRLVP